MSSMSMDYSREAQHFVLRFPTVAQVGLAINASQGNSHKLDVFIITTGEELAGKKLTQLSLIGPLRLSSTIGRYYIEERMPLAPSECMFSGYGCGTNRYTPHTFEVSAPFHCRFSDGTTLTSTIKISTTMKAGSLAAGHLVQLKKEALLSDIILVNSGYYPSLFSQERINRFLAAIGQGDVAVNASDRVGFDFEGREWFIERASYEGLVALNQSGLLWGFDFENDEVEWIEGQAKIRCFFRIRRSAGDTVPNVPSDFLRFRITTFR